MRRSDGSGVTSVLQWFFLQWLQLAVLLLVATEEEDYAALFDADISNVIPDSAGQSDPMPAGFQRPNGYAQGLNAAVRGRAATGTRCCQFIK